MLWLIGFGILFLLLRTHVKRTKAHKLRVGAWSVTCVLALGACELNAQTAPSMNRGSYNGKPVAYQTINGLAVTEGDIVIGAAKFKIDRRTGHKTPVLQPLSHTVNQAGNLWAKVAGVVTVPYVIVNGSTTMDAAITAFNTLFAGKFQWVVRTNQNDYVEIDLNYQSQNSCYATLGYTGGKENLQGTPQCNTSALLHEMGHIMGFAHE